jgi:hypothetical protein
MAIGVTLDLVVAAFISFSITPHQFSLAISISSASAAAGCITL